MGLFDKKYCDICGEKIGLLGNKKLEDGNMCKDCARKLSPWFSERRHSTLEEIKQQLQYREDNKEKVRSFSATRSFEGSFNTLYIDETKRQFAIGSAMNVEENPDILDLSQITSCRLDIDENREEEKYRDKDGEMQSYVPPRYKYAYDYRIKIDVNHPWFDDMNIKLNDFEVKEHDRQKMMDMERMGNEIIAILKGRNMGYAGYTQPVNGGYNQPDMGFGQNPYAQVPAQQGYNQPPMQQGYNAQPQRGVVSPPGGGEWRCSCGAVNTGKFCMNCGSPRPQGGASGGVLQIRCDKCGWVAPDPTNIPRFCPMCGDPINQNDVNR